MAINKPNYNITSLENVIEFFIDLKHLCRHISPSSLSFCENSIQTLCTIRNALESYERIVASYQTKPESTTGGTSQHEEEKQDKLLDIINDIFKKHFNTD